MGDVSCYAYGEFRFPELDPVRLEWALGQVIALHPMLRAVFMKDATQHVLAEGPAYRIARLDLSGGTADWAQERLDALRPAVTHAGVSPLQWPAFPGRCA